MCVHLKHPVMCSHFHAAEQQKRALEVRAKKSARAEEAKEAEEERQRRAEERRQKKLDEEKVRSRGLAWALGSRGDMHGRRSWMRMRWGPHTCCTSRLRGMQLSGE